MTGSQMAVRGPSGEPKSTLPSGSTQETASLWMKLNEDGMFMGDQSLVTGSKISPRPVALPASEYSPPMAKTRPSLSTPEAKNCLVLAIL